MDHCFNDFPVDFPWAFVWLYVDIIVMNKASRHGYLEVICSESYWSTFTAQVWSSWTTEHCNIENVNINYTTLSPLVTAVCTKFPTRELKYLNSHYWLRVILITAIQFMDRQGRMGFWVTEMIDQWTMFLLYFVVIMTGSLYAHPHHISRNCILAPPPPHRPSTKEKSSVGKLYALYI